MVVDAGVVVSAVAIDDAEGRTLRTRLLTDGDLHAPHLLDLEVASVLRRLVMFDGTVSPQRAQAAFTDLGDLPIVRYPHGPLLRRAWELRENVRPYDAAYVALAEALGSVLLTVDVRLSRAPGLTCAVELI